MDICPKCNSKNIKKVGPFARKVENGKWQKLSDQDINYQCRDCNNVLQRNFKKDDDL